MTLPFESAFPRPAVSIPESDDEESHFDLGAPGMTLRDWFAGMALAGYLASHAGPQPNPNPTKAAYDAYEYADGMLAARAGKGGGS